MAKNRVEILGVEFDVVTQQQAVERALDFVKEGGPHHICTPAMEQIMTCRRDPEFSEVLRHADLNIADGMSVVWMSRLNGTPLPERVTGVDLVPALCEAAAKHGLKVYFLGAEPNVAQEVADRLTKQFPGLKVAGTFSPPMLFETIPEENQRAIQKVTEANPDILFLASRAPRPEKWLRKYRHELGVPVMIGVGGAFNFIAGRERRAPEWVQRLGMEALWRSIQRPRDILGRIIRNAPLYFLLMLDKQTYRSQKSFLLLIRPLVLAALDAIVAAGSFVLAYALYFRLLLPDRDPFPDKTIFEIPAYSTLIPFVALISLLVILGVGLYKRGPRGSWFSLLKQTAIAATATLILLITFTFISKEIFTPHLEGYSRVVFALFGLLNFVGLTVVRSIVRHLEGRLHKWGFVADRFILIGARQTAENFAAPLFENLTQGQIPLGIIQSKIETGHSEGSLPNLGTLDDLRKVVAARKVDEIIVLEPELSTEEMERISTVCGEFRIRLSVLTGLPTPIENYFNVRNVGTKRVLSVSGKELHRHWRNQGGK